MGYIELIEKHTEELVSEINKIKTLPLKKEKYFNDGVDMYDFYTALVEMSYKEKFIDRKFNLEELKRINKCLHDIKDVLNKYNVVGIDYEKVEKKNEKKKKSYIANVSGVRNLISINNTYFLSTLGKCTKEVVNFIEKYGRLPECNEKIFDNGVDAKRFVVKINKLYKDNVNIKEKEEETILLKESIDKINKKLLEAKKIPISFEIPFVDKVDILIKSILLNDKVPNEYFDDGTSKTYFYTSLKTKSNSILSKQEITPEDEDILNLWNRVDWTLNFVKYRKYCSTHADHLLIYTDSKKLKKWYLEQVKDYYMVNKSMEQIEREELLTVVHPRWMGNNYNKKSLHL